MLFFYPTADDHITNRLIVDVIRRAVVKFPEHTADPALPGQINMLCFEALANAMDTYLTPKQLRDRFHAIMSKVDPR